MNPTPVENKLEVKPEQVQTPSVENKAAEAPPIKSEENQANWKAFREQREADRKAREISDKRAAEKAAEAEALKAALEAITNKPKYSYQKEDDELDETEEQRIDKRVNQIIAEREKLYEKERIEQERKEYPHRLNQTYNDFNKVCSAENLDYLEYHYPEVAVPFKHLPDGYEKWQAIYKAVKRFVPNHDSKQDAHKVDKNLQKPGSISSTGTSQGSGMQPSGKLTEERKAANWERMQRSLKGLSS